MFFPGSGGHPTPVRPRPPTFATEGRGRERAARPIRGRLGTVVRPATPRQIIWNEVPHVNANKAPRDDRVLVCGLGRFGAATAVSLARMGHEVVSIDRDPTIVQDLSNRVTHAVEGDSTNLEVLEQLGARECGIAVVGIGTSVESSVLTCANLVDLEVPQIWGKALSPAHGKILQRIGVHHVVYPEKDAGQRVAHLVTGRLLDYIEFDDEFTLVKMRPPQETQGFTLAESQIRKRYGVTVVGVKTPGEDFTYAVPQTRVLPHDILIVSGHSRLIEKFAARP
jgi:trk system potassium uptake protein